MIRAFKEFYWIFALMIFGIGVVDFMESITLSKVLEIAKVLGILSAPFILVCLAVIIKEKYFNNN